VRCVHGLSRWAHQPSCDIWSLAVPVWWRDSKKHSMKVWVVEPMYVVNDGSTRGTALALRLLALFVLVFTVFSATDAKRNARDSHVPVSTYYLVSLFFFYAYVCNAFLMLLFFIFFEITLSWSSCLVFVPSYCCLDLVCYNKSRLWMTNKYWRGEKKSITHNTNAARIRDGAINSYGQGQGPKKIIGRGQ
jgi:hypothetical protein